MLAPCAPTGVASPSGSPSTHSSRAARRSAARSSPSVASRRASRRFSSIVVSKMCACCETSPITRRNSISIHVADLDAVERHRPRLIGQEAQQDLGERRLARAAAPTTATVRPGARSRSTPSSTHGAGLGVPAAAARAHGSPRPVPGARPARCGSITGGSASITASIRAAARRTRRSAWVAVGRSVSSSNAASGTSAITASSTPSIAPDCTAATPTTSAPHIASPDST